MTRDTLEALAPDAVVIHGAREHNLQNISLRIPRGRFVVVTGVSGSGKSTLAFDLIFAEGQRRFLDAMNAYARQFVDQLARPDVDLVAGLPPTVSIEQRHSRGGGKSTVATVTEIHHFLRLLFARLGTQYCPDCQLPVEPQTREALAARLRAEVRARGALRLLAPLVKNRKGFHTEVVEWAARQGYRQIRIDGQLRSTDERIRLDRYREHTLEVVLGILEPRRDTSRARELVKTALRVGKGTVLALDQAGKTTVHSTARACVRCGRSFEPLDPKHFSYHSPVGWCTRCRGFGELFYLPEVDRGARADALEESWFEWQEGKRERCPDCGGMRLNPVARAVRLELGRSASGRAVVTQNKSPRDLPLTLDHLARASVTEATGLFRRLQWSGRAAIVARDIMPEIRERLGFLEEVGLGYLELGRGVPTLSGGESQRIRLAAQLGSNLSGVLYVLDEPTIGLHARDNEQLLAALKQLQRRGNSLLVVEHDEATMRQADHVIDLGPGAGTRGGRVVASGTLAQLCRHRESVTGRCLRETRSYPSRGERRPVAADAPRLVLAGATLHNLKEVRLELPLGRFIVVTGVSGSGKSTLLRECLVPALITALRARGARKAADPGMGRGQLVSGQDLIRAVYEVDQAPIGRTPRSIPATYVGFFDAIRLLFSQVPEARLRGYGASRFSFNSVQGRCPECAGAGMIKLEMSFLPPAFAPCERCRGSRFQAETLDIQWGGRTIAEVLELSVDEALELFAAQSRIRRALEALRDTGLGYLKLGQTSPTLSGGEAQRVKLVTHLLAGIPRTGTRPVPGQQRSLFLLEEPTIGLHMVDIRLLVGVLQKLVDAGQTVVVIEHNLDLIAEADWVIDLGPEGGAGGGQIVAAGTPEQIAACRGSHTGRFLRESLRPNRRP